MNYLKTYSTIAQASRGDLDAIQDLAESVCKNGSLSWNSYQELRTFASQNPEWLKRYNNQLQKDWGVDTIKSLTPDNQGVRHYNQDELISQAVIIEGKTMDDFSEEDKENALKKYAVTSIDSTTGNFPIHNLVPTNILPILDGLVVKNNAVLDDVTTIRGRRNIQVPEFDVEEEADLIAELASSGEKNITSRDGDTLNAKNKVQIVVSFSDLSLLEPLPEFFAQIDTKMIRSVQNKLVQQILRGNNSGNQFHGMTLDTGSGVNTRGCFDISDEIAGAPNPLDKLAAMWENVSMNISEDEEGEYSFYFNRKTFSKVARSMDLNDNYIARESIRNGKILLPDGTEVPFRKLTGMALNNGETVLGPMRKYYLNLANDISVLSDNGMANFISGKILMKSFVYADGGYAQSYKRNSANIADSPEKNSWRKATNIN